MSTQKYQVVKRWLSEVTFPKHDIFSRCIVERNVQTALSCVFKCTTSPQCKSAYFNQIERRCLMTLYVDTILPSNQVLNPNDWDRYVRVYTVG
ncbi:hypothetical protein EG68_10708 [Paragonimus skrjabini miyazakii]|uniref:Apple domain-containing protein n=1 Tax=Paragonimus skrjabini miyazakii TaxID=59628 RepID=A0A8S9YIW7_9TREM|nr:hypothetical protein EG68_10708 [Paragonimus skrjabini miyazakii]